jgi:hypothetical protein
LTAKEAEMAGFAGSAKGRLVLIVAAGLLAVIGAVVMATGLVFTLRLWMPWFAALGVSALVLLGLAGAFAWIGLRPDLGLDQEGRQIVEMASGMITDIPVEVARKLITDRPLAAVALASGFGALMARRPAAAAKLAETLLAQMLARSPP